MKITARASTIAISTALTGALVGCAGGAPAASPSTAPPVSAANAAAPAAPTAKASFPKMAPLEQYLMDRDEEIAVARSAAPPSISNDATVLVLTRKGYEKVAEGKNGFVCLIVRSWSSPFGDPGFWNPKGRAPVCENAAAARSVLPIEMRLTELALSGLSEDAIMARMKESIAKGEFGPPEIGAMSYMLSRQQYLSEDNPHWHPHLMFYMPGTMDGATWGANLPQGSAVFGGGQDMPGGGRMPFTIFFVPVRKWSDGTPS